MVQELESISALICRVGKLPALQPQQDFYEAGFSSINALELLVEMETVFEVSIPDDDFIAARTAQALEGMISRLKQGIAL